MVESSRLMNCRLIEWVVLVGLTQGLAAAAGRGELMLVFTSLSATGAALLLREAGGKSVERLNDMPTVLLDGAPVGELRRLRKVLEVASGMEAVLVSKADVVKMGKVLVGAV